MARERKRREELENSEVIVRLLATQISATMVAAGENQDAIAWALTRAGMDGPSIAAILGTTRGTVTKAVSRARRNARGNPRVRSGKKRRGG